MDIILENGNIKYMKQDEYIDWNLLMRGMNGELSEEEKASFEEWMTDWKHREYYERMVAEWNEDVAIG